jgi:hypothetical protein
MSLSVSEKRSETDMARRRYRRRSRVSAHLGCLGCSIPLLMLAAVIAAAAAMLA